MIIGAGVMGLGIGWRLAEAGWEVEILEAGIAGRGASWAAAGMLAAGLEAEPGEAALLALNLESRRRWPAFAHALEGAAGMAVGYRSDGTLALALTRDDADRLRHQMAFQEGLGLQLAWLEPAELRRLEPRLSQRALGAVVSAEDHVVDNRLVTEALRRAFERAGGTLREKVAVERITVEAGRATGVVAGGLHRPAETVVLAAGAWAGRIAGLPPSAVPPVRPIKGQLLALTMPPEAPLVRHVIWMPGGYLVPRTSGRLVIGATVEEAGFDASMTAGGVLALLEAAHRALPVIEDLPIEEVWSGFRPGSPDDAPVLGLTPVEGLVLATGHHRNGILLAPLTIEAVSSLILEGRTDPVIAPFGIERFAAGSAAWRSL